MPLCLKIKSPCSDINRNINKSKLQKLRWNSKSAAKFMENLTSLSCNVDLQGNASVDELVVSVTNKIIQANGNNVNKKIFEPKQKWFDWKCARYRKYMLKRLKIYRKKHTPVNKIRYFTARHKFMRVCDTKKLELYNKNLEQLNKVNGSCQNR